MRGEHKARLPPSNETQRLELFEIAAATRTSNDVDGLFLNPGYAISSAAQDFNASGEVVENTLPVTRFQSFADYIQNLLLNNSPNNAASASSAQFNILRTTLASDIRLQTDYVLRPLSPQTRPRVVLDDGRELLRTMKVGTVNLCDVRAAPGNLGRYLIGDQCTASRRGSTCSQKFATDFHPVPVVDNLWTQRLQHTEFAVPNDTDINGNTTVTKRAIEDMLKFLSPVDRAFRGLEFGSRQSLQNNADGSTLFLVDGCDTRTGQCFDEYQEIDAFVFHTANLLTLNNETLEAQLRQPLILSPG